MHDRFRQVELQVLDLSNALQSLVESSQARIDSFVAETPIGLDVAQSPIGMDVAETPTANIEPQAEKTQELLLQDDENAPVDKLEVATIQSTDFKGETIDYQTTINQESIPAEMVNIEHTDADEVADNGQQLQM